MVDAIKSHVPGRAALGHRRSLRCTRCSRSISSPASSACMPTSCRGGMKQRVCIAIGILLQPQVIIADEPTSALDVVTQRQVMETIDSVQDEINAAVILIGHDMGLMAQFVDKVAVMYAGRLVEVSTVREMFTDPKHPYAQALIKSLPSLDNKGVFQGIPGPCAVAACAYRAAAPSTRAARYVMAICSRNVRARARDAAGRTHRGLPPLQRRRRRDELTSSSSSNVSKVYSRGLISAHATVALQDILADAPRGRADHPDGRRRERERQDHARHAAARLHHADDRARSSTAARHQLRSRARSGLAYPPRSAGGVPGPVRGVQPVLHGRPPAHRADHGASSWPSRSARRRRRWTRR